MTLPIPEPPVLDIPATLDHDLHEEPGAVFDAIANPLREGMTQIATAPPCVMVIFGVSGDLTSRKLMPSLYDLAMTSRLAEGFSIIG
ncbi:MAG: glucose-6-phosphate dehydrogenase, partial [Thermomicrobiales bacterium]